MSVDTIRLVVFALFCLAAIVGAYFVWRLDRRCPKCKSDWTWRTTFTEDDPRSTFQERERIGERFIGERSRAIHRVTTWETGIRTIEKSCRNCGHSKTTKSKYREKISSKEI